MKLLSLDFDPVYGDSTRAKFSGDLSVFDYDAVIWDPAGSFRTYMSSYHDYFQNLPQLSDHQSVQIQSDARRRRTEFLEFVSSGRVLVVIARPPQQCYIDTGERTHSGTGRNQKTTRIVNKFDLLSTMPISNDTKFVAASGRRIEVDGDGPIQRLLRKYKDRLEYETIVTNPPGTPLAQVTGTDRKIASIQRSTSGGYLILLPPVDLSGDVVDDEEVDNELDEDGELDDEFDQDRDGWAEDAHEFQTDLLEAIELLSDNKVIARPDWAKNYSTAHQQKLRDGVTAQQTKVDAAREKHAKLKQELEASEARDQLFLGTGRALELEVRSVLELLGGQVTEPEPGRDDWKVVFPEGRAVVEVKGVGKSAAEKHAAQLEKWVATELEETGAAPKGILVANTWRDTPLEDRSGKQDFPDQMLPYAKSRNHCLLTGLQLFVIREELEADPKRAEYWRPKIMKASGVLPGAIGWHKTIKKTESGE